MGPIYLTAVVGAGPGFDWYEEFSDDTPIIHQSLAALPWDPPWPWYPTHVPHWGLAKDGTHPRIWYAGIPKGQERIIFAKLVRAIGRNQGLLSPLARDLACQISGPVRVAVLTTPNCPRCAEMVRVVHAMALLSAQLYSTAIMLEDIPDLIGTLSLNRVPVLFINQRRHEGAMNEWIVAQMIRDAATTTVMEPGRAPEKSW